MPHFVTIIRDSKVGVLAGPFEERKLAESYIDRARDEAIKVDPMAHFDSLGVSLIPGRGHPGVLNERLGLPGAVSYGVWREGKPEHYHQEASA